VLQKVTTYKFEIRETTLITNILVKGVTIYGNRLPSGKQLERDSEPPVWVIWSFNPYPANVENMASS
jgi:hypothetical protein